jgi:hypothetical protein
MMRFKRVVMRRFAAVVLAGSAMLGPSERSAAVRIQNDVTIPSNATFKLQLLSPISTANNKKGDKFNCLVVAPDEFKESTVEGRITKLKSGGRAGKTSEIGLAFSSITMPDGRAAKFDGQVMEVYDVVNAAGQGRADQEGQVAGKSTRKRTLKRSVAGALIGGILGAIVGGGQGAAIGAAVGAGLGATTALSEKSPNIEFSEGTLLDVKTAGRSRNSAPR